MSINKNDYDAEMCCAFTICQEVYQVCWQHQPSEEGAITPFYRERTWGLGVICSADWEQSSP